MAMGRPQCCDHLGPAPSRLDLCGSMHSWQLACTWAHEPEVDGVTPISLCIVSESISTMIGDKESWSTGISGLHGWNSTFECRSWVWALGSFSPVATFLQAVKLVNLYKLHTGLWTLTNNTYIQYVVYTTPTTKHAPNHNYTFPQLLQHVSRPSWEVPTHTQANYCEVHSMFCGMKDD